MARNSQGNLRRKYKYSKNKPNDFYIKLNRIQKMLRKFVRAYKHMHHPCYVHEYTYMDKLRSNLKLSFDTLGTELWRYGYKEQQKYYKILDKFKYYYSQWKHWTYYTYLYVRFGVPFHLMKRLKYFKTTKQQIFGVCYL